MKTKTIRVKHPLADWWLFFRKFLRHGTSVASVTPSSPWLARALIEGIDFDQARCVIELGAGTGPVTAELLRRARGRCRVIVIDRDRDFCRRLRQRFPEAEVVFADACALDHILDKRGIDRADHIISGLPLPSFPASVRDRLLESIGRRLGPRGTLRQVTVMPWVYFKLYCRYFTEVKFRFVGMNLPPGGVYVCRGWRGA